uniref:Vacuolar protein sortingassociated protein VTA1 put n=1 Tax=Albugo laibachii Nc14 TaxID=890382 RepID=F0WLW6_9STRA|nr:vacuolar protein sortingassociated protein VTA1 put [Albugo laibachii Nc14]|eukprot:CCA22293.1 vacuolar protein sortingassociated protein VTA1 put [Albugo laibachii Nc14]
MTVQLPLTFKSILPFLRRADELERDESRKESKTIAFFCRQYAMEMGIKLRENDTSSEGTEFLLGLMDRLERDKGQILPHSQEDGKTICLNFALEVFLKAEEEDRANKPSKNTARTYYAAGTFFDILSQFGELSEDVLEKRKYCKYRAATILKELNQGPVQAVKANENANHDTREQIANGPSKTNPATENKAPLLETESTRSTSTLPPVTGPPLEPVIPIRSNHDTNHQTLASGKVSTNRGDVSENQINDAIELAKFAIASLKVKDIPLATDRLNQALRSLR